MNGETFPVCIGKVTSINTTGSLSSCVPHGIIQECTECADDLCGMELIRDGGRFFVMFLFEALSTNATVALIVRIDGSIGTQTGVGDPCGPADVVAHHNGLQGARVRIVFGNVSLRPFQCFLVCRLKVLMQSFASAAVGYVVFSYMNQACSATLVVWRNTLTHAV
eukprot:6381314-Amphidinium_carterae.2